MIIVYQRGDQKIEVDGVTRGEAAKAAKELADEANHDFRSYRVVAEYPRPRNKIHLGE